MPGWPVVAEEDAAAEAAAAANVEKVPEEIPGLVLKGIEEFNRGEFFEAHEYLEGAWRQETRPVRSLYQGILQVGVGFHHQQNANWRGATSLLRNGIARLAEFEPEALGIDVSRLVRGCGRCLEELERLGRKRVGEFDQELVPKVEWVEPDHGKVSGTDIVGLPGLEPGTSSLSEKRSNRLSYRPATMIAGIMYNTRAALTSRLKSGGPGSRIVSGARISSQLCCVKGADIQ